MSGQPITIIAEAGINHLGDMTLAAKMVGAARDAGADVFKVQIYSPERILDLDDPLIQEHWDVIKAAELSFEQVCDLKNLCDAAEIEFLASVFHPDRVEWTEKIGMKRYKIASRSVYNDELAKAVAATGKDVILSWGYYDSQKGQPAICRLEAQTGIQRYLYCVSKYPALLEDLAFTGGDGFSIFGGMSFTDYFYGFSDHTVGITAAVVAMSLGAKIIEKHFTLDRNLPGPDQVCSIETDELRHMCDMRDDIEEILDH